MLVTRGDGVGRRRAAGRDATVVSIQVVAGGSAVVIPRLTETEGVPLAVCSSAVVATRRARLAGLMDRAVLAAWTGDDLVAGPGRVEHRCDVLYLGVGRAVTAGRSGRRR